MKTLEEVQEYLRREIQTVNLAPVAAQLAMLMALEERANECQSVEEFVSRAQLIWVGDVVGADIEGMQIADETRDIALRAIQGEE